MGIGEKKRKEKDEKLTGLLVQRLQLGDNFRIALHFEVWPLIAVLDQPSPFSPDFHTIT
jgi:hypothetical protein